jgi:hypothetical protein
MTDFLMAARGCRAAIVGRHFYDGGNLTNLRIDVLAPCGRMMNFFLPRLKFAAA